MKLIIKSSGHKYLAKKPNGKGGWLYTYPNEIGRGGFATVHADADEAFVTKRTKSKSDFRALALIYAKKDPVRGAPIVSSASPLRDENGARTVRVERVRTSFSPTERAQLLTALDFSVGDKATPSSAIERLTGRKDASEIALFAEDLRQGAYTVLGKDHPDQSLDNVGFVQRDGRTMAVWLDFGDPEESLEKARKLHGRRVVHGMKISIENAKGTTRHWYDEHGKESGSTKMYYDYGYIRGTLGTDGDHVDVYVGPNPEATEAYVVTQMKKPDFTEVDEQKVMLGFDSAKEARAAYLRQYDDSRFFGSMKTMPIAEFKKKVHAKENHGEIIKAGPHKYVSRKPDGKGGWLYEYDEPKDAQVSVEHGPRGLIRFRTKEGRLEVMEAEDHLRVVNAEVEEHARGTGQGRALYEALASYANKTQKRAQSDTTVEQGAVRAWEGLLRRGHDVHKNKDAKESEVDGEKFLFSPKLDAPVFVLYPKEQVNKASGSPSPNHKYKSRKPDGKGGWIYEYDTPHETTGRTGSMRTRDEDVNAAVDYVFDVDDMREGKMAHSEVVRKLDGNLLAAMWPDGANTEDGDDFVIRFEPGVELGRKNIHFYHAGKKQWEFAEVTFRSAKPGEMHGGSALTGKHLAASSIEVVVPSDGYFGSAIRRMARETLAHELTHANDTITHSDKSRKEQGKLRNTDERGRPIYTKEDYAAYRNQKVEVTAKMHEYHRHLTDKKAVEALLRNAREAEEMSDEEWTQKVISPLRWAKEHSADLARDIESKLYTPKNEKRILRMIADTYQAILEGRVKPIRKSMWASNGFTREEASKLAKLIDLDFSEHDFSLADFTEGLNVELEHKDVTHGKAVMTAKIALAHLKEKADYYQRLRKVEKGSRFLSLNDIASLRKADGSKPPGSGWAPIPGGHKNGMRRRKGNDWEYWYPSGEAPSAHPKRYTEEDYENGDFDKAPLKWHPKKGAEVDVHSKAPVKYAGSPMKLYQIVKADEAKGYVYARDLHANKHEKPVALRIDRLVAVEYAPDRRVGVRADAGPAWTPGGSTKTGGFSASGGEVSGTRAPKFADSKADREKQPGTWAIENGVYPMMSMTLFPTRNASGKPEREKATGVAVPDHGKQQIIAEYEPLVTSAARAAKARYGLTGSETELELRRAGLEGMLAAMTTYRADVPFAAYAKGYVRNYIAVAASRERLGGVKLDSRFERNLGRFFAAEHAAKKAYGDNPTDEQVAEYLNVKKHHFVPHAPAESRSQAIPMNDWKLSTKIEGSRLVDTRSRPGRLSIVRAYRNFLAGEGSTAPLTDEVAAFPAMHMGLGLDAEQQIAVRQAVDRAARQFEDYEHGRYRVNMHEVLSKKFGLEGDASDEPSIADLAREVPIYSVNADGKRKQVGEVQARVLLAEMIPAALEKLSGRTEGRAKDLIDQAAEIIVPRPPPVSGPTYEERLRDRAAAVTPKEVSDYRETERSRLERLKEAATARRDAARSEPERQQHELSIHAASQALNRVDRMPEEEIRDRLARKLSPMTSEMRRAALATISAERESNTMVTDPQTGERRLVRMAKSDAGSAKLSPRDALFMERYPQLAQLIYAPDTAAALPSTARRVVETLAGIRGDA